jgi:hypothetical protein
VRIPSFSRQSEPDTAERPATTGTATATDTSPVRPRSDADGEATTATNLKPVPRTTDLPPAHRRVDSSVAPPPPPAAITRKPDPVEPTAEQKAVEREPVGPRPRASFLATLGLILGVASVLLVLSGPLLGYGIGVAGLGLVLSLSGIHATGKRHVAGKTDALIGMVLSLGAIVLGVLALTGSLSWLGTDVQPVNSLREWLDTQFGNRF